MTISIEDTIDEIDKTNYIGICEDDRDTPIYRIYNSGRLKELFEIEKNVLTNATKWDDPYENFFLRNTVILFENGERGVFEGVKHMYGQCWSFNSDSDAMWRIYAPNINNGFGIQVKTTIRKLFDDFRDMGSKSPRLSFFIGKVKYYTEEKIKDFVCKNTLDDLSLDIALNFAKLFCVKREAFEHENEIRLILNYLEGDFKPRNGQLSVCENLFHYPIEPNHVFDEIIIDPRICPNKAERFENELKELGCTVPISHSKLYETPRFEIKAHRY